MILLRLQSLELHLRIAAEVQIFIRELMTLQSRSQESSVPMIYTLTSWLMSAHRCIFQSPRAHLDRDLIFLIATHLQHWYFLVVCSATEQNNICRALIKAFGVASHGTRSIWYGATRLKPWLSACLSITL